MFETDPHEDHELIPSPLRSAQKISIGVTRVGHFGSQFMPLPITVVM